MATPPHGIGEEIGVGDLVETALGMGVVTRISYQTEGGRDAMLEIDLGHKWLSLEQVRSIRRHRGDEPEPHWDEHD